MRGEEPEDRWKEEPERDKNERGGNFIVQKK